MAVLLEPPVVLWECPSCGLRDQTREARPHSRMHSCKTLAGLTTPMQRVERFDQLRLHHRVIERGDYVGAEIVRLDGNQRPVMALHTERPDGSHDTTVYAPTAATGVAR